MLKKLIAVLISLTLIVGLAPAAALAAGGGGGAAGAATPAPDMALTTQAAKKSLPKLYTAGKLTVSVAKSKAYTGKAIKPNPTVKLNGKKLKKGTDYTVVYRNASGKEVVPKKAGTYKVVITGKGAYKGKVAKSFKIVKKGKTVKNKAFTLTLPAYWTGKVRVQSKSLPANDYRDKNAGEVRVFDKKTGILLLRIYYGATNDGGSGSPATYARYAQGGSIGAADDPWVGYKIGSRYALVVTCNGLTWSIDVKWSGWDGNVMGLSTVSQANRAANLLTGGKIKNSKQRDAKGVSTGDCIEKYLKANVLSKIDIN